MKQPAVYIMASQCNGTLYTGVTSALVQRVWQHREGITQGFTFRYEVKMLVWYEQHETMESAISREKAIKKWNRAWKLRLIEERNPQWLDLWPDITGAEVQHAPVRHSREGQPPHEDRHPREGGEPVRTASPTPAPLDSRLRGNDEVGGESLSERHPRAGGDPESGTAAAPVDSRLRGNDEVGGESLSERHPRAGGDPESGTAAAPVDSRLRGNDEVEGDAGVQP